jgi:DNA-3-methyladenine glycosylase I
MKQKKKIPLSKKRCDWCLSSPLYIQYHDEEWGVPVHRDRKHFEFLILEGAQAGLSWFTILKRRAGYKKAFANFDPKKVARFTKSDSARLLKDEGLKPTQSSEKERRTPENQRVRLFLPTFGILPKGKQFSGNEKHSKIFLHEQSFQIE